MTRKKTDKEFKPVNIMSLSCWDILLHKIAGTDIETDDLDLNKYSGSSPVSMDLLKIFELCRKDDRFEHLRPYLQFRSSKLFSTDAIVNVSFSSPGSISVKVINDLHIPSEFKNSDKELKTFYDRFVETYYVNLLNYGKEIKDPALKAKAEKWRKKQFEDWESYWGDIATDIEEKKLKRPLTDEETRAVLEKKFTYHTINGGSYLGEDDPCEYKGLIPSYINLVRYYLDHTCSKLLSRSKRRLPKDVKIRLLIYSEGFSVISGGRTIHYSVYKRSASKAKTGNCVFIQEDLLEPMKDWSWMGLKIDEKKKYDLTSLKAYEALVMSSIEGKVRIPRSSILMLDSVRSEEITGNIKVLVRTGEGESEKIYLQSSNENGDPVRFRNTIWDGQALLDESIFEDDHGMMLLRNKFFKACAFNAKIQQYFKDHPEIRKVKDMFGKETDPSKIRMIVTIDSFKLAKFADCFFEEEKDPGKRLEKLYRYWLKNIDEEFGVVKQESPSLLGHGKYHEVSYQVLNTLPLTKDDIRDVMAEDLRYIELLRDNPSVMLHRLRNVDSSARKKYFIYNMLKYCPDFAKTKEYRVFLQKEIADYRKKMKTGRLKVRGDFYVLCSMPLEMLEYAANTCTKDYKIKPYLGKDEVYIKSEKEGLQVTLFRYPHMNSGSCCVMKSAKCDAYDKYLNLCHSEGSNIVVVSPWENNIMVKLGGADFDSDTALYVKDKTIAEAAKRLNDIPWLCPEPDSGGPFVAKADDSLKTGVLADFPDALGLALTDCRLKDSGAGIGQISNLAQLFNSILWDKYFSIKAGGKISAKDEEYLKTVYDCVLKLSVLNELEIDSSKHGISIDMRKFREAIGKEKFGGEPVVEHYTAAGGEITVVPAFLFDYYKESGNSGLKRLRGKNKGEKYWNCPVDNIGAVLCETGRAKRERAPEINIEDLFVPDQGIPDKRKLKKIREGIVPVIEELRKADIDTDLDGKEKDQKREEILDAYISEIGSINKPTMAMLFKYAFCRYSEDSRTEGKTHKKGDYKYPALADKSIRYRYLGILFAIGERIAEKNKLPNPAIECIKGRSLTPVPDLIYFPEFAAVADENDPDGLFLWGDMYIIGKHI